MQLTLWMVKAAAESRVQQSFGQLSTLYRKLHSISLDSRNAILAMLWKTALLAMTNPT
jgi:hypothetical protein